MALPTNTGAFIHKGVNCTPNVIQTAQGVPYDNTSSGLSATNVQGAIDEVDGKVFYGVCDTEPTVSGDQRIWTVTLNNGDGFALTEGATVYIKFTHEETGTVYPTFPCLDVNDTGAKPIYMNYTSGNIGYVPSWREGQVCVFTYDGNNKWFQTNSVQSAYLTPYSNSSSGLTATNVQGAIDEVNNKLPTKQNATWIKLGDTTGTTEIAAPTTWNEMIVYGEFGGNSNYGFSTYVIHTQASGFPRRFIEGCGVTNDFHQAIWHLENYKIGLDKWQYNATDYTSASKLHIYYR